MDIYKAIVSSNTLAWLQPSQDAWAGHMLFYLMVTLIATISATVVYSMKKRWRYNAYIKVMAPLAAIFMYVGARLILDAPLWVVIPLTILVTLSTIGWLRIISIAFENARKKAQDEKENTRFENSPSDKQD